MNYELSMLIAKMLSAFYLALGLSFLMGQFNPEKLMKNFIDSPALTIMSGFFMIVLGVLSVEYHNIWVKDWPVLITLVGWAVLIKGIWFVAMPNGFVKFKGLYKNLSSNWGFLMIALGLLFGYFGF